eukprot:UN14409
MPHYKISHIHVYFFVYFSCPTIEYSVLSIFTKTTAFYYSLSRKIISPPLL